MSKGPITGQVLTPDALLKTDEEVWRQLILRRPLAFLAYPYVRAVASCVPSVRVCRIM